MNKFTLTMGAAGFLVAATSAIVADVTLDLSGIASGQPASAAPIANAFNALQTEVNAMQNCPADMVQAGSWCIDTYEAFVTTDAAGTTAAATTTCDANGSDCSVVGTQVFAQSAAGVTASTGFTWFQAQQACANVSKQLIPNAIWQMGAADSDLDVALQCNDSGTPVANDANSLCRSNYGAINMVGNVHEWVADWIQGAAGNGSSNTNVGGGAAAGGNGYGQDLMSSTSPAASQGNVASRITLNMPAAIIRGGSAAGGSGNNAGQFALSASFAPSRSEANIGFRCGAPVGSIL